MKTMMNMYVYMGRPIDDEVWNDIATVVNFARTVEESAACLQNDTQMDARFEYQLTMTVPADKVLLAMNAGVALASGLPPPVVVKKRRKQK